MPKSRSVLGSAKETPADVMAAIDEINDPKLRAYLLEWFYFNLATTAMNGKQLDEAEKLTAKVEDVEQRAFLHTEIAKRLGRRLRR